MTQDRKLVDLFLDAVEVQLICEQVLVGRHDRAFAELAGVVEVAHVPTSGQLVAHPGKVRTNAAGTPLEWTVVDGLATLGILAVTQHFVAHGADLLGVAVVAALRHVDVKAGLFQGGVGRHRGDGFDHRLQGEGRDDLEHRRGDHGDGGHDRKEQGLALPATMPSHGGESADGASFAGVVGHGTGVDLFQGRGPYHRNVVGGRAHLPCLEHVDGHQHRAGDVERASQYSGPVEGRKLGHRVQEVVVHQGAVVLEGAPHQALGDPSRVDGDDVQKDADGADPEVGHAQALAP